MYVPKIHRAPDATAVIDYIRHNGFATLVSTHKDRMVATHLPLYVHDTGDSWSLQGHMSRANEQTQCIVDGGTVMAIFMNTHAYISSSWYDHVNVPTWNYIAVHVYGRLRLLEGVGLAKSLESMVDQYEHGRDARFQMEDMASQDMQAHIRGIVGFEIEVDRVESAYKLSQNRSNEDHASIVNHLTCAGEESTAKAMMSIRKNEGNA